MFRWPGRLTADYIAGRRRPYLKPIQVYLTIAVIFFVFSGNFFQYELGEYEYVPVIGETADLLESEMKRRGETADVYEDVFNARLDSQKKTMFALLVPLFALALIPFYHRRMIGEHMIYSIHVQGALLLFMIGPVKLLFLAVASIVRLIAAIAPSLGPGLSGVFDNEMSVILLIYVPFLIYNFIALRVVYGGRRVVTGAVAIALFIWHIILVVFVFRLGLFFTTFYSLKWFG